jgi:hypothetical protein
MQATGNVRVRKSEEEWRALISQWKMSGQSLRDFCGEQELQLSSFLRWRQRLARSSAAEDFVPVTRAVAPTVTSPSWSLELVLPNGFTLRFQG